MKKVIFYSLFAAALMSSCTGPSKKELKSQNDSLYTVLTSRDAELNDIMGVFNDIQDGFREINEAENRVDLGRGENSLTTAAKIKDDILFISEKLQSNREQIAKLEKQLANSSYQNTKLKKTIENLTAELEAKQKQIEELQTELAAKNIRIAELDSLITDLHKNVNIIYADNVTQTKTVAAQDKALNTAYYVFGTKKELKEQGILEGKEVLKSGGFNKDYFTEVDIRKFTDLPLYSKNANLLTTHPDGSYQVNKDSNGQLSIKITDPTEFWSVSRYLVIQVK